MLGRLSTGSDLLSTVLLGTRSGFRPGIFFACGDDESSRFLAESVLSVAAVALQSAPTSAACGFKVASDDASPASRSTWKIPGGPPGGGSGGKSAGGAKKDPGGGSIIGHVAVLVSAGAAGASVTAASGGGGGGIVAAFPSIALSAA